MNRIFKNIIVLASIISLIMCTPIKAEWHWKQLFNIFKSSAQSQLEPIITISHTSQVLFPKGAGVFEKQEFSALTVGKRIFSQKTDLDNSLTFKNKKSPHPYFSSFSRKLISKPQKYDGLFQGLKVALKPLSPYQVLQRSKPSTSTTPNQDNQEQVPENQELLKKQIQSLQQATNIPTSSQNNTSIHTQPTTKKSVIAETINVVLNEIISKLLKSEITIRNVEAELQQYPIDSSLTKNNRKLRNKRRQLLYAVIDKNWSILLDQNNQAALNTNGPKFDGIVQVAVIKCLLIFGLSITKEDIKYAYDKQSSIAAVLESKKFLQSNNK